MDFSIRIPETKDRHNILKKAAISKKDLPKIKDILFKPKGTDLKEFYPGKVCVRVREFTSEKKPSTLFKLIFIKTKTGYTDERELLGTGKTEDLIQKAKKLDYEEWGKLATHSVEHDLNLEGNSVQVLAQEIAPLGTFLKIESETQEGLDKALKLLQVSKSEKIEKNATLLLAEKLNLVYFRLTSKRG